MFPTISDLVQWLTGIRLPLPFQTFGTMMALAFGCAYWAYRQELKRKEAEGRIAPVEKTVTEVTRWHIVLYAVLAGLIAAKLVTAVFHYRSFVAHPSRILFSGVGNWPVGIFVALLTAFLIGRKKSAPQRVPVHPYQIMNSMLWWCGLTGIAGAILFHKLEHLPQSLSDPWQSDGFTYYGGLLFGIATALFIAYKHKIPLVHMADAGSPAMILAYGIGRLGCHLSGDGDWGIVNRSPQPSWLSFLPADVWAYTYPSYDQPVFPTSLYEGIVCILLFVLLWQLRKQIVTPGKLFALYCLLNGGERLWIETIKINPVYTVGFLHFTQAQLISFCFILTGLLFLYNRFTVTATRTPAQTTDDTCLRSQGY